MNDKHLHLEARDQSLDSKHSFTPHRPVLANRQPTMGTQSPEKTCLDRLPRISTPKPTSPSTSGRQYSLNSLLDISEASLTSEHCVDSKSASDG